MKKSTFAKKYTVAQLDKIANDLGLSTAGMKKSEMVDLLFDRLYPEVDPVEAVADPTVEELIAAEVEAVADPVEAEPKYVMELADMSAEDVLKRVFSEGLLYKIDAQTWWGKSSRSREEEVEKIDKSGGKVASVVKTLIDPVHLGMIKGIRGIGERAMKKHSFPFLGIRGVYFVPKGRISTLEEQLKTVKIDHDEEVRSFIAMFGKYREEWKPQMGDLYDEKLYPTTATLNHSFKFSWTKFRLDVPNDMLSSEEYREELEKQKANLVEFVDETITTLAAKLYDLMMRLKDQIDKEGDVTMKQIKSIQSFLNGFMDLNISRNSDLERMAEQLNKTFGKVTKDVVDDEKVVKKMGKVADKLIAEIEKSADERIARAIEF